MPRCALVHTTCTKVGSRKGTKGKMVIRKKNVFLQFKILIFILYILAFHSGTHIESRCPQREKKKLAIIEKEAKFHQSSFLGHHLAATAFRPPVLQKQINAFNYDSFAEKPGTVEGGKFSNHPQISLVPTRCCFGAGSDQPRIIKK